MKKSAKLTRALLAIAMTFSFVLSSCSLEKDPNAKPGEDTAPPKPYKDFAADEPYRITYTTEEGGDGCVANIEYHPYFTETFELVIPDTAPDGRAVTKVTSNPVTSLLPCYVLEEDFAGFQTMAEAYYGVTYEDAQLFRYERNHPLAEKSFYLCKFMSYFVYKSRAEVEAAEYESEEKREQALRDLSESFPITDLGVNVYVLDKAATTMEIVKLWLQFREFVPTWSDALCYETLMNAQKLCETNGVDDPNIRLFMDGYSGMGEGVTAIQWPASLKEIGDASFMGCNTLRTVTIPGTVRTEKDEGTAGPDNGIFWSWYGGMGAEVFAYCTALEEVTFAEGVNCVPAGLFNGDKNLKQIHLPSTLEFVGSGLYYEFELERESGREPTSFATIHFNGTKAQWEAANTRPTLQGEIVVDYGTNRFMNIHCTDGVIAAEEFPSA